jgi:hypothetical protein
MKAGGKVRYVPPKRRLTKNNKIIVTFRKVNEEQKFLVIAISREQYFDGGTAAQCNDLT